MNVVMRYPGDLNFGQFRNFLRLLQDRSRFERIYTNKDVLEIAKRFGIRDHEAFLRAMVGIYLVPSKRDGDHDKWEFTREAKQHASKNLTRMSPATLARLKEKVIERARTSRDNPDCPMEVGKLLFFGSALDKTKADYGDLDIVIVPIYKREFSDWNAVLAARPEWNALSYYPEHDLTKYVRNRSGYVHPSDWTTFEQIGNPQHEVVYTADGFEERRPRWYTGS